MLRVSAQRCQRDLLKPRDKVLHHINYDITHTQLNLLEEIVCNECQQNDRHRADRSCKVAPEVIR